MFPPSRLGEVVRNAVRDALDVLRFLSRLPLPALHWEQRARTAPNLARLAYIVPLAGALLSAIGALTLWLARLFGLPPLVSAGLAVGVLVMVAGALHEDGLADVADGFGGGATAERKLEIMRDSRIGAYGAAALMLTLLLRVGALSALVGLGGAAAGLILAGAASRTAMLAPLALLRAARPEGLAAAGGRLEPRDFLAACVTALVIACALGFADLGFGRAIFALALALAAGLAMTVIARRQIGGFTGDVAGAAQQVAEVACLCGLLIGRGGA